MDDSIRKKLKDIFSTLKYSVSEETIREKENLIQFKLERGGIFCIVTYIDNKPLLEVFFPCPYSPVQITKISELLKEQDFLFELRKLLTAPNLFYSFDINNGEFKSFSVFVQFYKELDDIGVSDISNALNLIINYGLLAHTYVLMRIDGNQIPPKSVAENQKNLDNPMFS